jgi:hypothetical protein
MAFAAENRRHITFLTHEEFRLIDISANARKPLEIFFDVDTGVLARNTQLIGEAEGGNAVDDPKVDRLGAVAHVRWHAFDRHAKHFRGGHRVNILALGER